MGCAGSRLLRGAYYDLAPSCLPGSFFDVFPVVAQTRSRLDEFFWFLGAELHCFHWIWLRFIIVTTHFSNGPLIIIQRKFSVLRAR